MTIFNDNLHTLWELVSSLYNPLVIGAFSFFSRFIMLAYFLSHLKEKERLRKRLIAFLLAMLLMLSLNLSVWLFCQLDKFTIPINCAISGLLTLFSLIALASYWSEVAEKEEVSQ